MGWEVEGPWAQFWVGDGQHIRDNPLACIISTGLGVEVKCFTGFAKSDSEPGDWTWATHWLITLCILCQRAEATGEGIVLGTGKRALEPVSEPPASWVGSGEMTGGGQGDTEGRETCYNLVLFPGSPQVGDFVLFGTYIIQLYMPLNWFGTYYR